MRAMRRAAKDLIFDSLHVNDNTVGDRGTFGAALIEVSAVHCSAGMGFKYGWYVLDRLPLSSVYAR